MSNAKLELSYEGIGQILKSDYMNEFVASKGTEIAKRCGEGYGSRTHNSGQRIIANVYADSKKAHNDNLQNNTLLKNLY